MGLKGYLIVDPECGKPCDDAVESIKDFTGTEEIEILEVGEAMRRGIEIGEPSGVPVLVIGSEITGKRLATFYFQDEEGNSLVQAVPALSAAAEAEEASPPEAPSEE